MRILTGITPSGTPHLGNYIGAIKPALLRQSHGEALYFIADLHSLVKLWDAKLRQRYILELATSWLACGLDPDKAVFYLQSQVPEISELSWILNSITAKGLLNRAHAYKDLVAKNREAKEDDDHAITMGLFCYPVLMAADIIGFNADYVPVGKDQVQHIEIVRDIAGRFNHLYGETFTLPQAIVDDDTATLPGLDGRKMSKSYGNTIPLFESAKRLRKLINKIVTNSLPPEAPKQTQGCSLFQIYRAFATKTEQQDVAVRYANGIGWGEMKQLLFEKVDTKLADARERYEYYMAHSEEVADILDQGAQKARTMIIPILDKVKALSGLGRLA